MLNEACGAPLNLQSLHVALSVRSARNKMPEQLKKFHTSTRELARAMRDAVIEGFRFHNGDREHITAPQLQDAFAESCELSFRTTMLL